MKMKSLPCGPEILNVIDKIKVTKDDSINSPDSTKELGNGRRKNPKSPTNGTAGTNTNGKSRKSQQSGSKSSQMTIADALKNQTKKRKSKNDLQDGDIVDSVESGDKKHKTENGQVEVSADMARCKECHLRLDDPSLKVFQGIPDAVEEFITLTDPKLSFYNDAVENDSDLLTADDVNDLPMHKLTNFCIYDRYMHMVGLDGGLIERDSEVFASGYVKPVFDEDPSTEGGIATASLGPIIEWWLSGHDGGENVLVGFCTTYAQYILMSPSQDYNPFMDAMKEKIHLSKRVIEYIFAEPESDYEDLLNHIQTLVPPEGVESFTEESLLRHSQFIIDQVVNYDSARAEYEVPLIVSRCMRDLIKLVGASVGKKRLQRARVTPSAERLKKPPVANTLATTTPLVRHVFETLFSEQICQDPTDEKNKIDLRRKRCGICETCQQPDCGECRDCKSMVKFGGSGKSKQACSRRRCPNMAIDEANDDDECDDDMKESLPLPTPMKHTTAKRKKSTTMIKWVGRPTMVTKTGRKYYSSCLIKGEVINCGDYVLVEPDDPKIPFYIAKCVFLYEENGNQMFHAHWLSRSADTVLGETGDPHEVFLIYECENVTANDISRKCQIDTVRCRPSPGWYMEGGSKEIVKEFEDKEEGRSFYMQKSYDIFMARFEDIPSEFDHREGGDPQYCFSCKIIAGKREFATPTWGKKIVQPKSEVTYFESIKWEGQEFRAGDCIYLMADAFTFSYVQPVKQETMKDFSEIDEEKYPEYYRKNHYIKGSNSEILPPFKIAVISELSEKVSISRREDGGTEAVCKKMLRVNKFYRPEDTHKGMTGAYECDNNLLYWSSEETLVDFNLVEGKCYVVYVDNLTESIDSYLNGGPDRFYFDHSYNAELQEFEEPPRKAREMGSKGKGKGKKSSVRVETDTSLANCYDKITYPTDVDKLVSLDIFSGCGGLTEGFHQAGITDTKWAIEREEMAARAFKLNFPSCTVFTQDCNLLLKSVLDGKTVDEMGRSLPRKGQVEFLCGGPPCQGFSGMNRFNSRQYSLFRNSLIVTYLSYVDYFRPKFCVMENVRNFVTFKKCMVLKLTLTCLVKMGYQVAFMVLQAGSFGVPQTRRRAIILAAAPGEKLPSFPQATHVFTKRAVSLSVAVNNKRFDFSASWRGGGTSAPLRTMTVRDALSDLPKISNGAKNDELSYNGKPLSHFQKKMRGSEMVLKDHICKDMSALVEARMKHIPTIPGSDWRDLPNIEVKLSNGMWTKKLIYNYRDTKTRNKTDKLRGVCPCSEGKACDPVDRQDNTLIPWCLPHTSNRHNNWAGLYGRLDWDGFFGTTVTNPEPMGKQGCVLHPVDDRVVSVRECARSQGFPDKFRFCGSVLERHRQVGNAVPPPLAKAIGLEILFSLV